MWQRCAPYKTSVSGLKAETPKLCNNMHMEYNTISARQGLFVSCATKRMLQLMSGQPVPCIQNAADMAARVQLS